VIHDPCPNDGIDLFVPNRPLKPMTEVVPSTNLDADCFSSGMQMATAGIAGVDWGSFADPSALRMPSAFSQTRDRSPVTMRGPSEINGEES
jgi:hypothetical protein